MRVKVFSDTGMRMASRPPGRPAAFSRPRIFVLMSSTERSDSFLDLAMCSYSFDTGRDLPLFFRRNSCAPSSTASTSASVHRTYSRFAPLMPARTVFCRTRRFAARCAPLFVANSFSKNFSLYGERVGGLSVVATSADEADRVRSQLKRVIRANYSSPQTHGARIVAEVLGDAGLRRRWVADLAAMRERVRDMRRKLVEGVAAAAPEADFDFVLAQNGMFSYSGLDAAAVARLREEHGIYAVDSGRICVAALNDGNVGRVARAVAGLLPS